MPFFSSHDNIFLHKYGDFQLLMLHKQYCKYTYSYLNVNICIFNCLFKH